jgi:hypothetical protein
VTRACVEFNCVHHLFTSDKIRGEVEAWINRLPRGAVSIGEDSDLQDDEYGTIKRFNFVPHTPTGCQLTVGITHNERFPFYLIIEQLDRLGLRERLHLAPWLKPFMAALYLEPVARTAKMSLTKICECVAQGRIDLRLSLLGNTLIGTSGSIGSDAMNGVGFACPVIFFGLCQRRSVAFGPWY